MRLQGNYLFSEIANRVKEYTAKNPDKKIYLTFHAAIKLPPDIKLAPRGVIYEATEPDYNKDFEICSELLNNKYKMRGLTDKKVYKDLFKECSYCLHSLDRFWWFNEAK